MNGFYLTAERSVQAIWEVLNTLFNFIEQQVVRKRFSTLSNMLNADFITFS